ncbi:Bug family tripartite tricarboxylate transporter substrate binding protein [Curvibacter microcysteis]
MPFIRSAPAPASCPDAARRQLLGAGLGLGAAALMGAARPARAAVAGGRPIRFVVPYAAGGTTDLVARVVGQRMAETLGQPVVIENRPGAGGNVGMDAVAKAAPDGLTLGLGAISTNALNPHVYKSMAFDPRKDFTAVGLLGYSTIVLEAGPALPVRNVAELLAWARKNPGLSFGTAGAGTSMHLAGALFAQLTQTELNHVAYKGSVPGINDLLGGHLPLMFDNLPASLPHIQAGRLRALAVAGKARSPSLPDVPTLAEAGIAGYEVDPWFGVYAPAGLPATTLQALSQALVEALGQAAVRDKLQQAGFLPRSSSPEALAALSASEYERLGRIARAAHMSAE